MWTFPLCHKSDVLPTLMLFHAFVGTQFQRPIQCFQTDNGKEFDNTASRAFFAKHGIALRLTCPYTSQQNGRAERVLRTLNDGLRALMFQTALPPSFWLDALATSTYLLNRRPCRPRQNSTPFELLFGTALTTVISASLVVSATLTLQPPLPTSCRHVLFAVSSWDIPWTNVATSATTQRPSA